MTPSCSSGPRTLLLGEPVAAAPLASYLVQSSQSPSCSGRQSFSSPLCFPPLSPPPPLSSSLPSCLCWSSTRIATSLSSTPSPSPPLALETLTLVSSRLNWTIWKLSDARQGRESNGGEEWGVSGGRGRGSRKSECNKAEEGGGEEDEDKEMVCPYF
eukprot:425108-Hanusia_phi.AAC.1